MQENVAQRIFSPKLGTHTHKIVVPESRQQAGRTLCIVIELREQNSERWSSMQRKWRELIIQVDPHWNREDLYVQCCVKYLHATECHSR